MGNDLKIQAALDAQTLPRFLSSVPQHASHLSPTLRPYAELALAVADQQLRPAGADDFGSELTACLALVVPTGMSVEDREDWLRAAWVTLEGIPADLLSRGAATARKSCDHPSKIVPAILREVEASWNRRRNNRGEVLAALSKMVEKPEEPRCTPEQARAIMRDLGFEPDEPKADTSHRGDPIAPDAEWYRAHGIEIDTAPSEQAA